MLPLRDSRMHHPVQHRAKAASAQPCGRSTNVKARSSGNHYQLLGVERGASDEDIKRAFRKQAKELHPDVNKEEDAGKRFQAVNKAYQVLSDPGARAQYDRLLPTDSGMSNFFRDVDPDATATPSRAEEELDYESWRRQRAWEERQRGSQEEGWPASEERGWGGSRGAEEEGGNLRNPYEFMRHISRYMSTPGGGPGVSVQADSAGARWQERVQQQMQGPGLGRRGGWQGARSPGGGQEDPLGPGQGVPEWTSPRWRQAEEDEEVGGLEWKRPGIGRSRDRFGLGKQAGKVDWGGKQPGAGRF